MKLRIAKLRNSRSPKVSQSELGDAVGVGQNSISRIERGEQQPTLATLEAIAAYLGVDFIDLFEDYNRSEIEQELRKILRQMNDDQIIAVLSFARLMIERRAS